MNQGVPLSDDQPDPLVRLVSDSSAVRIDRAVSTAVAAHVGEDTSNESGGVLVGTVEPDGSLSITASIRAEHAQEHPSSLTFTHDTWTYINETLERDFPDLRIVGWYHSHPGFSVFLSEYDTFIHRNFFSAPWQVAYVVDPLLQEDGFFGWSDDDIVRFPEWTIRAASGRSEASVSEPAKRREAPESGPPSRSIVPVLAVAICTLLVGLVAGLMLAADPKAPPPQLVGQAVVRVDGVVITRELTFEGECLVVELRVLNPTAVDMTSVQIVDPVPAKLRGSTVCPTDAVIGTDVRTTLRWLPAHATQAILYAIRLPKDAPPNEQSLLLWDQEHSVAWQQLQLGPSVIEAHDLAMMVGDQAPVPIGERYSDGSIVPRQVPTEWTVEVGSVVELENGIVRAVEAGVATITDQNDRTRATITVTRPQG